MFYVCAKYSSNAFKVIDTEDGVVDICTLEELEKFINCGITIKGVSKLNNKLVISVLYPLTFKETEVIGTKVCGKMNSISRKQSKVLHYFLDLLNCTKEEYISSSYNDYFSISDICMLDKVVKGKGDIIIVSDTGVKGYIRGVKPKYTFILLVENLALNWISDYNADNIVIITPNTLTIQTEGTGILKCDNFSAYSNLYLDIHICCKFMYAYRDLVLINKSKLLRKFKSLYLSVQGLLLVNKYWLFSLRSLSANEVRMSEGSSFMSMVSCKIDVLDRVVTGMFFKSPELCVFRVRSITKYISKDAFCHVKKLDLSGFTSYNNLTVVPNLSGFKLCSEIRLSSSILILDKGVFSNVTGLEKLSIPCHLVKSMRASGLPKTVKVKIRDFD